MRNLLIFTLLLAVSQLGNSQCSWDDEICISGCSDTFYGDGPISTCFDPNATSSLNPIQIDYCYSSPKEEFFEYSHPQLGTSTVRRRSIFMLCVPDDICEASLDIFSVVIDETTGQEISATLVQDLQDSNPEDNRPTFCMDCPSGKKIDLLTHRNILNTIGTYRIELRYSCCDGDGIIEDDNIIGGGQHSFYYEFVNAASDVDVEIAFTASQQIENLNGDPDIDGIITTDGSFPGPSLGPASAGVRVSAVGNGIIDYSVEVYEVDCSNPDGGSFLVNSQQIPYDGEEEIFYSFLNIPNWENIYDPTACYKVVTRVNSVCGTYSEEAFFTITDQCTFCLINPNNDDEEMALSNENVQSYINGSSEIVVDSKVDLHSILVLDEFGRILQKKEEFDLSSGNSFSKINSISRYYLIVTIDKNGNVYKSMIPNLR